MAGIIDRLTEGIVNRDMRAEGHALLTKVAAHRTLEGLGDERAQNGSWLVCLRIRQRNFSVRRAQ